MTSGPEAAPHLDLRQPLDREVAATLDRPAPWVAAGLVAVLGLLAASVVLAVVVVALGLPVKGGPEQAYNLLATALAAGLLWLVARRVADRYGGWRPAFGFVLPAEGDGRLVLRWSGLQVGARFVLAVALAPLLPRSTHGGNLEGVSGLSGPALVAFGVGAVLAAPVLEELMFRGVLLRGLMRRLAFWPAAALSTLVFAVLHLGGVSDWTAIVPTLVFTALFGLLQCRLVRQTARLGPAMGVHAVTNLVFLALALAAGG